MSCESRRRLISLTGKSGSRFFHPVLTSRLTAVLSYMEDAQIPNVSRRYRINCVNQGNLLEDEMLAGCVSSHDKWRAGTLTLQFNIPRRIRVLLLSSSHCRTCIQ